MTAVLTTLATLGGFSRGGLIADANGDLFGTIAFGGSNQPQGTVFELVNNNGAYTLSTLVNFDFSNGANPYGSLIADANGDLFGTTQAGGPNQAGTVFELVNNGTVLGSVTTASSGTTNHCP